jgi:hypothetical protein
MAIWKPMAATKTEPTARDGNFCGRETMSEWCKFGALCKIYRPFKDLPFSLCGYFAAIIDGNLVHLLISL